MKKVIWLDVDGVLLDYTTAFLKYTNLPVTYDTLHDYDLRKLFDNEDECISTMLRFAMSDEFAELEPIVDSVDLEALKNAGYELRIITKLPAPPKSKINRIMNLSEHFGPVFSEIVFTGEVDCKLDYLRKRKASEPDAEYTIVEDNPSFLKKAEEFFVWLAQERIEVLGIRHPYNKTVADNLQIIKTYTAFEPITYLMLDRQVWHV